MVNGHGTKFADMLFFLLTMIQFYGILDPLQNIINYIRQHNHTLDPDKVHLVGRVVWVRDLVVEGGVVDPASPNQTIFLQWDNFVQSAENDFIKYSIAA